VGTLKDKVHITNPHLLEERTKKQHLQRHFNNFERRTPKSEQCLTQVYWVHSVRRAKFSASAVSQETFTRSLHQPLNFTRLSIYNKTLEEHWVGAYWSSRKKTPVVFNLVIEIHVTFCYTEVSI